MLKLTFEPENNFYWVDDGASADPFDTAQDAFDYIQLVFPGSQVEVNIKH